MERSLKGITTISDYKSVHSKLRAAELKRENTELRGKVRSCAGKSAAMGM